MIIKASNVQENGFRDYLAEARALGLAPGEWPETIETTLGNTLPFVRMYPDEVDGGIAAMLYKQDAGRLTLTIIAA